MTHRYRRPLRWLLLLLILTLPACDSGAEDEDPSLNGSWQGTTTISGLTVGMAMQLNEASGAVTGNGTVSAPDPVAVTITGTYTYPNVSLTLRSTSFADLSFAGTVSGDGKAISGSLNGSGFNNFGLTIRKQ